MGQRKLDRLLADHILVGQAHAVGRQHACERMDEHAAHAQGIRHQAGMLAACAAEALKGVARDVVAACHRDFLDGIGHLLHGDIDKALGHHFGTAPGLACQFVELGLHRFIAELLVGARPEHLREIARLDLADHHIRVGHGQRAATPVARRSGIGARALRADAKARTVEFEDGAAARGNGVDAHHRRAHANARHLRLELAFELACVVRHVGRSAPHVETDHPVVAAELRRPCHADDAARRSREDGVLALEGVRIGEAAGRLHEEQLDARHFSRHLLDVAPKDG